jgi:hypothetical protein
MTQMQHQLAEHGRLAVKLAKDINFEKDPAVIDFLGPPWLSLGV